jgi:hypothetical protein
VGADVGAAVGLEPLQAATRIGTMATRDSNRLGRPAGGDAFTETSSLGPRPAPLGRPSVENARAG